MFEDFSSTYNNGTWNEVTGIYPAFQNIEISGNTIRSDTGAGILLTGTANDQIDGNQFSGCGVLPDADPIYSYFGEESRSALVLSFAENVTATGDVTGSRMDCTARMDSASSRNVGVQQ